MIRYRVWTDQRQLDESVRHFSAAGGYVKVDPDFAGGIEVIWLVTLPIPVEYARKICRALDESGVAWEAMQ